jgi:hypothetical protein
MNLVTDLLPKPSGLGDSGARTTLSAFRRALESGDRTGLAREQQDLVDRIAQANAKIESGGEIVRISELMTLAQFGAGSAGIAIANACSDPSAIPAIEGLLTGRFLIEVVLSGKQYPHLFPADFLRNANVSRDAIAWPGAGPVYGGLLDRATLAVNRASAARDEISSPALRKYFDRERAQSIRQLRKLAGKDPNSTRARLNTLDRIIISLTILLHIRGTP